LGIQNGDFKAVRFNEAGYRDSALNPTMDLQTSVSGDTTTVVVAIDDLQPMYGVALNLHYDTGKYTPVSVDFSGLVADPIELTVTKGGYVALAQASLAGQAERSGKFAVVTFSNEPSKTVSASGDAHNALVNKVYDASQLAVANQRSGFVVTKATAEDAAPATAMIYATFALGDGDQNSESNASDLTPMVALGWFNQTVSDTNFAPAVVDFDANGEVSVQDLAILGAHFGEVTSDIEILLGDDTTFATTDTAVTTVAWATGTYPAPVPETALTNWAAVFRNWNVDVTMAQLQAADTNADGTVYVSARTSNSTGKGPAFDGVALTYVSINTDFVITDFDAEIVGAATTPVADATTLDVIANTELTYNVTGISGTYQGTAFTPADRGGSVPDTEYDDTLAAVAGLVTWTTTLDAGMIATSTGVTNPAVATGTAQTVMIFPDDDPDYPDGTPEGSLIVNLAATGAQIPTPVTFNMDVSVDTDPDVPVFSAVSSDQGQVSGGDNWYLSSAGETIFTGTFAFGTIVVAEADYADIQVQLFNLDGGAALDFTVVPIGDPVDIGNATIKEDALNPGSFNVSGVVGLSVIPGATYGLRMGVPDGASIKWTSINKPGAFYEVAPLPAPADLVTLPSAADVGPSNDYLWIYYPDPRIRRNPGVVFGDGVVTPDDPEAYTDILKSNGNEFALTNLGTKDGPIPNQPFPEIVMVEGTDASTITSATASLAGVGIVMRTPNYVVVDIAALTPPGIGDTKHYAFKTFGAAELQANWPATGTGLFDVAPMDITPPAVDGVNFGINIFDDAGRGDAVLANRDFTNKNLNASTVLSNMPDVLFVEFNGGRSDEFGTSTTSVALIFEDSVTAAQMTVPLSIRAVGLEVGGLNRIGIHDFVAEDFKNPGQAGWPGILDTSKNFDLILDSPLQPGTDDFVFGNPLVVTGTNPNP